jgi:glucose-6-phosphate isomerase
MIEFRHPESIDKAVVAKLRELWPQVTKSRGAGFVRAIQDDKLWESIEQRLEGVGRINKVLVLGIGGSSLGTQVISECFSSTSDGNIFFLEAVDRYKWDLLRNSGDWRDRHIVIISKSGGTLETLAWVERLAQADKTWIKSDKVTVIASPGTGALQKWAAKESIPILEIPEDVGGRFSVLSPVGMFPAGLLGLSRFEFREGARWSLNNVDLAAQLAAVILDGWKKDYWVTQLWTYSEALKTFGQWWQQLWSESLAKKIDRAGKPASRVSTPLSCIGPRDQHSLLQQLMEGYRDKQVLLTRVKSVEAAGENFRAQIFPEMPFYGKNISLGGVLGAEAQAFEQALIEAKVPHSCLELQTLNEQTLGALFMTWQMVIALLGEYLDIDAFNQPGVELGKRHAEKILRQ